MPDPIKKAATGTPVADYYPNIVKMDIPPDIQAAWRSRGIDVFSKQKELSIAIKKGGEEKSSALNMFLPAFDKERGGNQFSGLLQQQNKLYTEGRVKQQEMEAEQAGVAPVIAKPPKKTPAAPGNAEKTEQQPDDGEIKPDPWAMAGGADFNKTLWNNSFVKYIAGGVKMFNSFQYLLAKGVDAAGNAVGLKNDEFMKHYENKAIRINEAIDKAQQAVSFDVSKKFKEQHIMNSKPGRTVLADFDNMGSLDAWLNDIGQGLGSMLPIMATGGGVVAARGAGALLAEGAVGRIGLRAALKAGAPLISKGEMRAMEFATSYIGVYGDMQKDALDHGLSFGQSASFASVNAGVSSAIEMFGTDYMMKSFGLGKKEANQVIRDITAQEATNILAKTTKEGVTGEFLDKAGSELYEAVSDKILNKGYMSKVMPLLGKVGKSVGKAALYGGVPESLEEFTQTWGEAGVKKIFNNYLDATDTVKDARFDDFNAGKVFAESLHGALVGGILGAGMGALGGSTNIDPSKIDLRQNLFSYMDSNMQVLLSKKPDAKFEEVFPKLRATTLVEQSVVNGNITPEHIDMYESMAKVAYNMQTRMKDSNASSETRFNMFNASYVQTKLNNEKTEIEASVAKAQELDTAISETKEPSEIAIFKAQKAAIGKELGPINQETGRYQIQEDNEAEIAEYGSVFENFINMSQENEARANAYLKNYQLGKQADDFVPASFLPISEGRSVVSNEGHGIAMEGVSTPIPQEQRESIEAQLGSEKYEPIKRKETTTKPISDPELLNQHAEIVQNGGTYQDISELGETDPNQDESELLTYAANQVAEENGNSEAKIPATDQKARVNGVLAAYDLLNKIKEHKGEAKMPIDEYLNQIGVKDGDAIIGELVSRITGVPVESQAASATTSAAQTTPATPTVSPEAEATIAAFEEYNAARIDDDKKPLTIRQYLNNRKNPNKQEVITEVERRNKEEENGAETEVRQQIPGGSLQQSDGSSQESEASNEGGSTGTGSGLERIRQEQESVAESATGGNNIIKQGIQDAEEIINGEAIFERFSQAEQRGLTDGGRIHVEATAITARSVESGSIPDGERQEKILEEYARESGHWVEDVFDEYNTQFGEPIADYGTNIGGVEAIVWSAGPRVIKAQQLGAYYSLPQIKLDGITIHNFLFPETKLKVIGFSRNKKDGEFLVIVEQPFVKAEREFNRDRDATFKSISTYMQKMGFRRDENAIIPESAYTNGDLQIRDMRPGNAIMDADNNIIVIDPMVFIDFKSDGGRGTRLSSNKVTRINRNNGNQTNSNTGTSPAEESRTVESQYIEESQRSEAIGNLEGNVEQLRRSVEESSPGTEATGPGTESDQQVNDASLQAGANSFARLAQAIDSVATAVEAVVGEARIQNAQQSSDQAIGQEAPVGEGDNFVEDSAVSLDDSSDAIKAVELLSSRLPNVTVQVLSPSDFKIVATQNGASQNVKAFVAKNGAIYYDSSRLTTGRALHEFGHVWVIDQKQNNPEVHEKGISLVAGTKYETAVRNNPDYANYTNEEILDEALVNAIEENGEAFLTTAKKLSFKEYISEIVKRIKDVFKLKDLSPKQLESLNLKSFAKMAAADIISGEFSNPMISSSELAMNINNPLFSSTTSDFLPKNASANPQGGSTKNWLKQRGIAESKLGSLRRKPYAAMTPAERATIDSVYQSTGYRLSDAGVLEAPFGFVQDDWKGMRMEAQRDIALLNITPNTPLSLRQKTAVNEIMQKTGYRYSDENLKFIHGDTNLTVFAFGKGRMSFKSFGAGSSELSLVNQTLKDGLMSKLNHKSGLERNIFKQFWGSLNNSMNNETFSAALDSQSGFINSVIQRQKREDGRIGSEVRNKAIAALTQVEEILADYTLRNNERSIDTVRKTSVKRIVKDKNGAITQEKVEVPVAVAIMMHLATESQLEMGKRYHGASLIINEDQISLSDMLAKNRTDMLVERDNKGDDVPKGIQLGNKDVIVGRDFDTENTNMLMSTSDYGDMVNSLYSDQKVADAIDILKELLDDPSMKDHVDNMFKKFSPDSVLPSVDKYYPLQPAGLKTEGREISQEMEDKRFLHERRGKPPRISGGDVITQLKSHYEAMENVLSHNDLVHNLRIISNESERQLSVIPKEDVDKIQKYIGQQAEAFIDFDKYKAKGLGKDSGMMRLLNSSVNNFTKSVFIINMGIQFKQLGTLMSIMGQGVIDEDLLKRAPMTLSVLGRGALAPLYDFFGGSQLKPGSTVGLVNSLFDIKFGKTTDHNIVMEMLGEHLSGQEKIEWQKNNASVIHRLTGGANNEFGDGIGLPVIENFDLGKTAGRSVSTFWHKWISNPLNNYGMGLITRADRGVIIAMYKLAKLQAEKDVLTGKITKDQQNLRLAHLTEELVYKTNQIGKVSELTGTQMAPNPMIRLMTMFTGQTQRLLNQTLQTMMEHMTYGTKKTQGIYRASLRNTLLWNAGYVTAVTSLWGVALRWMKGDDQEKDPVDYYWKKLLADMLRNTASVVPGAWLLNGFRALVSRFDNENWAEGLIDIPGTDQLDKMMDATASWYRAKPGPRGDKQENDAVESMIKQLILLRGLPKTLGDILIEHVTTDKDDLAREAEARRIKAKKEAGITD